MTSCWERAASTHSLVRVFCALSCSTESPLLSFSLSLSLSLSLSFLLLVCVLIFTMSLTDVHVLAWFLRWPWIEPPHGRRRRRLVHRLPSTGRCGQHCPRPGSGRFGKMPLGGQCSSCSGRRSRPMRRIINEAARAGSKRVRNSTLLWFTCFFSSPGGM